MAGHLYIIKEREFCRLNEPIFKVGRSACVFNRFMDYPNCSIVCFVVCVKDEVSCETEVLRTMQKRFVHHVEYGNEYYEGNLPDIIDCVMEVVSNHEGGLVSDAFMQGIFDDDKSWRTSNKRQSQSTAVLNFLVEHENDLTDTGFHGPDLYAWYTRANNKNNAIMYDSFLKLLCKHHDVTYNRRTDVVQFSTLVSKHRHARFDYKDVLDVKEWMRDHDIRPDAFEFKHCRERAGDMYQRFLLEREDRRDKFDSLPSFLRIMRYLSVACMYCPMEHERFFVGVRFKEAPPAAPRQTCPLPKPLEAFRYVGRTA